MSRKENLQLRLGSFRLKNTTTAVAVIALMSGYSQVSNATSLFSEGEMPNLQAQDSIKDFDGGYNDVISKIERDAQELAKLEELSPEQARKKAEAAMETMRDLLGQVEPGGIVEERTRGASDWMKANQELARSDQTMSESERQQIEQLWAKEIARMTQARSRLETMRGTLQAELKNFEGALSYLSHLEMLKTAEAMNLATEKIIGAMNEALTTLREQKRPDPADVPTS